MKKDTLNQKKNLKQFHSVIVTVIEEGFFVMFL